jgi:putative PIN family toxin of toxin-antitoxin system
MPPMKVVLDTSVLVAAVRSRTGASFAIVSSIPNPAFEIALSVGLYTEWQDVLTRAEHLPKGSTPAQAIQFLRYLASQSHLQSIHFLWRPFLPDSNDDMVLELAFAASCTYILTHNVKDFRNSEQLGVKAITPQDFLKLINPLKP